jgi:hypothetical protein
MKNLSRLLLVLSLLLSAQITTQAQGASASFVITQDGNLNVTPYNTALESANLDHYRLVNERRFLVFDTGVVVELLSSNELNAQGISFDPRRIITDSSIAATHPAIFKLAANGHILETYDAPMSKTTPKTN